MANSFNKEEIVAFENMLEGFEDALVLSKAITSYKVDNRQMERSNDTIWRPQPYIAQSVKNVTDVTSYYKNYTQLAVPATIGYSTTAPWVLTAKNLRDSLQESRLYDAAKQRLASDINYSIAQLMAYSGTVVVQRTASASGYDDVAQCEAAFNEQGIANDRRYLALSTRDYNGMANDLSKASRSFGNSKSDNAYEKSYIGDIAGFETLKLDYAIACTAAAGSGITMDTRSSASNYYTPKATSTATTGETSNVDNRYQTITVSSTTSVAAGDSFTIAGCDAVHHITKGDTGQLKTFRVVSVASSTTMVISPPIISAQGATDAEYQYQNCTMTSTASNAAITFLNVKAARYNPFWHGDAIEIIPGRYAVPADGGVAVMRGTTEQGIEIVMQKWQDIDTMNTKYRVDCLYGLVNKQPEMSGVLLFGQS